MFERSATQAAALPDSTSSCASFARCAGLQADNEAVASITTHIVDQRPAFMPSTSAHGRGVLRRLFSVGSPDDRRDDLEQQWLDMM